MPQTEDTEQQLLSRLAKRKQQLQDGKEVTELHEPPAADSEQQTPMSMQAVATELMELTAQVATSTRLQVPTKLLSLLTHTRLKCKANTCPRHVLFAAYRDCPRPQGHYSPHRSALHICWAVVDSFLSCSRVARTRPPATKWSSARNANGVRWPRCN